MVLADAIKDSSGWKILAIMLFSELVIEVESDTFVGQRYVDQRAQKNGPNYRPDDRSLPERGNIGLQPGCDAKSRSSGARKTCSDLLSPHQSWYRIRYRIESILVNS